ncbi:hypothetical protein CP973_32030 [Streptomyces albofaciens JCM 4342]|uniref:hypothetical protein n=1 Tax=Streptomyces albofaciens TaxID=66866 RepID=UPI00123A0700|nr:hypothetical protein [Streptomyces albofaciens]KAA6213816.1 hypothetical protein CP973_32030 [Streptomyces albofaciens JCM 4342]
MFYGELELRARYEELRRQADRERLANEARKARRARRGGSGADGPERRVSGSPDRFTRAA